jgi:hypothetical protein
MFQDLSRAQHHIQRSYRSLPQKKIVMVAFWQMDWSIEHWMLVASSCLLFVSSYALEFACLEATIPVQPTW